jgi:hypothetical protein
VAWRSVEARSTADGIHFSIDELEAHAVVDVPRKSILTSSIKIRQADCR